jgi:hypothetical protein
MVQSLGAAHHQLRQGWQQMTVAGAGGFPYPWATKAPDVPAWVTAQELRTKMQEWHKLENSVQNAWRNVPQAERGGLRSPEE